MPAYIPFPQWIRPEIVPFLPIRWYGLMYLFAFAIAYILFRWQLKERKLTPKKDHVTDFFFWTIIGLLIGARLAAVTIYDPEGYYLRHPLQIILPFPRVDGKLQLTGLAGMSYHGGLVGAIAGAVIYMKVKKLDVLDWGDMLVTGIPLGYTFGRLGNFINGELYGRVTTAAWGMVFPHAEGFPVKQQWVKDLAALSGCRCPGSGTVNLPRHPSQLYEGFFEGFVLWLVMWFLIRKRRPFKGFMIASYVIGYGVIRFFIEYTRGAGQGHRAIPSPSCPWRTPYPVQALQFHHGPDPVLPHDRGRDLVHVRLSRARGAAPAQQEAPRPTGRKLRKKLR